MNFPTAFKRDGLTNTCTTLAAACGVLGMGAALSACGREDIRRPGSVGIGYYHWESELHRSLRKAGMPVEWTTRREREGDSVSFGSYPDVAP
jgi:hypothetical protein